MNHWDDFDKKFDRSERRFWRVAWLFGFIGFVFYLALIAAVVVGTVLAVKHFG